MLETNNELDSTLDMENVGELEKKRTSRVGSGLAWLVLAACIWGTVGVSSALLNRVETTPPMLIAFLRLGFASPVLVGLAWLTTRRNPFRLNWQEWGYFGVMGLAMAAYQVMYFLAIPLASVTLVVVIALCSSPLIVAFISIPVFKERITSSLIAALTLSLTGTALLAFGGGNQGEVFKPEYLLGTILALGTGLAYSVLVIFSKLVTRQEVASGVSHGPIQPVAVAFTLGAIVLFPIALASGSLRLNLAPGVWLIAAYLGLVPTALAYVIFLKGMARASATAASITTMLEPAIATFLAWALLGEQLTPASLLGSLLLLVSVILLSRKKG